MIRAEGVGCRFGAFAALSDATLEVGAGEFVALIGPNGSGKTTLLRALGRTLPPTAGRVLLEGQDLYRVLDARAAARRIATVAQDPPLGFDFRVGELVQMGRHPHRPLLVPERPTDREAVRAALERTQLWELRDRPLGTLSGGQQRRAFLARALAQEPVVLLLDEPTAHLDLRYQIEMLGQVPAAGRAVIAVLHDLNLARLFATRAVLLDGGRIRADGPPAEVLTEARLVEVFGPFVRVVEGAILPALP